MATAPVKLSALFKTFDPFSNVAGGFKTGGVTTPATNIPAAPAPAPNPLSRLSLPASLTPPATGIQLPPNSPLAGIGTKMAIRPDGNIQPLHPAAPVAPASGPLFGSNPSGAPVGPSGATGATGSPIPPQWLKADGTIKTPAEIAEDVGSTLRDTHSTAPDIGQLAVDQFADPATTAAAQAKARQIGNTRNDIAVGETDPYKVAGDSGVAYTPAELNAIQQAYAGIYDPALDTALAKVDAKQKADAAANVPFTLGKDDVRYDGQGNPIAVGISSASGSGGTYVVGQNPIVDSYVTGFKNGTYKASDIPDAYKDLVAQGIAQAASAAPLSKTSLDALSIIDQIKGDPGIDAISGARGILPVIPGTEPAKLTNLTKQLQATISLGNRQQLKGSGAISDFEFKVLGDAATALGLDGNGHTNLSAADFADQLGKLELKLQVGPLKTLTDSQVQYLSSPAGGSATPDEIRAIDDPTSFNSAGNASASKVSLGTGNRPQRNFNPGDLKTGGLADSLAVGTDDQGHLIFPDAATGFKALTADLTAKVGGGSQHLPPNPTLAQLGSVYAEDPTWAAKVARTLGIPVDTHTQTIPIQQLAQAIAKQEGFYA